MRLRGRSWSGTRPARPGGRRPRPDRDRAATGGAYPPAVDDWRRRRADIYRRLIAEELPDDGCGAFLVWGDPALYDSTMRRSWRTSRAGVGTSTTVVPGITASRRSPPATAPGSTGWAGPVQSPPGRQLAERGLPDGVDDLVVMLDARTGLRHARRPGPGHLLGRLPRHPRRDPARRPRWTSPPTEIARARAEARARKGWIMDTYLLRRAPHDPPPAAAATERLRAAARPAVEGAVGDGPGAAVRSGVGGAVADARGAAASPGVEGAVVDGFRAAARSGVEGGGGDGPGAAVRSGVGGAVADARGAAASPGVEGAAAGPDPRGPR